MIKNYMEDIKALTLNNLPQRYTATEKEKVFTKAMLLSTQFKADVLKESSIAIKTVSENPRHPLSKKITLNKKNKS